MTPSFSTHAVLKSSCAAVTATSEDTGLAALVEGKRPPDMTFPIIAGGGKTGVG
jgi:hypothetical protein